MLPTGLLYNGLSVTVFRQICSILGSIFVTLPHRITGLRVTRVIWVIMIIRVIRVIRVKCYW
jgi:hypothetical protein